MKRLQRGFELGLLLPAGVFMCALLVGGAVDGPSSKSTPSTPPTGPSNPPASSPSATNATAVKIESWTIASGHSDPAGPAHYIAFVKAATGDLFGFGCDKAGSSTVYAVVLSHKYLAGGSNPTRDLEYAIDRGPTRAAKWDYLENYAYMRDPDAAREIAGDVAVSHTLDVRAFTYELFAVDAHFDTSGAKTAIETLYRDCRG